MPQDATHSPDDELARVTASQSRRVIGTGSMVGLGAMLLYVGLSSPPSSPVWLLFLLSVGGFAVWFATRLWSSTGHALILTRAGLMDSDGTVLAPIENIQKVDRSMFAMKPSNGFLVILKSPAPRAWRPGLWWRLGRRVAVGGVTSAAQTKPMADILAMTLAEAQQND